MKNSLYLFAFTHQNIFLASKTLLFHYFTSEPLLHVKSRNKEHILYWHLSNTATFHIKRLAELVKEAPIYCYFAQKVDSVSEIMWVMQPMLYAKVALHKRNIKNLSQLSWALYCTGPYVT